jgi:methylated-DNA-[protein]-cysteine S-methyltransferase
MYYTTTYASPVGTITLAGTDDALAGLWLEGQKYYGASIPEEMVRDDDRPVFARAKAWLDRYFAGEKPPVSELPLAPNGSAFRQDVWDILCAIPYGATMTYGEIAQQMAHKAGKEKMSSQAVGGAVGHNPISIIIPCHRVVGANGSLTGYAGGISKKLHLLEHEGVDVSGFFVPTKGTAL